MKGILTLSLICWLSGAPHGVLAAVVDGLGLGALDLGGDGVEVAVLGVHVVGADDLAAELGERRLEGGGETGAVGLLVVDEVDVLDLRGLEEVLGREGALDLVRGGGAEVGREGALLVAGLPVVALGQLGAGVGGGDLGQLGVVERLLHRLGDAGVQRADDTEDLFGADELDGVLLADGGLGLVVEGFQLEGDAGDGLFLVRRLDGEVGGVLDAEAEGGQVAGERGVEADDDRLVASVAAAALAVVARTAGGEGECSGGEHCGEYEQRTVSHEKSFPWRGLLCLRCRDDRRAVLGWYRAVQQTRPAAR